MSEHEIERSRNISWQDPMIGASAARGLSGLEYMRGLIRGEYPPPPIAVVLGFGLSEIEEGKAIFTSTPAEYHYNPIGMVHGGFVATILDSAMGCAVSSMLPAGVGYTTIELHINLIKALSVNTGPIRCEAEVIHAGRSVATAEGRVIDADGKLYAHGTTTCMIFGR